ncbi:tRNA (adenosine(37)-N6)-threonylcarbamoyltransferase complex ATPase subunit type 1 TsaE [Rarobacter incanus]|uniref:tRNA threonylcarbamoyladenosine biosynthesis protein TsaE n=1 Tax=Rarobacter incanus TaxID=153494 RepID=A0A542SS55_9MICO|nr:tRNA (adenosine(37)-N6)-threonylcarbamoyltransferase complex ATPase subunit type 1 TsaE [Rarobacter incanus]TQK77097.1 tRNA threonylcarbamoyladenosine biosynthesis protein TsaE [Rarobacter incanus]
MAAKLLDGYSQGLPTADDMRDFGARLAALLRPGDLVILTGPLGAGKTTLTQGIGTGLGVRGHIVSPTFTIAREYPGPAGAPGLVHVDAYRLGSLDELDALDLDTTLDESVTVVEWGAGVAEVLSEDRLEVTIDRPLGAGTGGDAFDQPSERRVTLRASGARWASAAWLER